MDNHPHAVGRHNSDTMVMLQAIDPCKPRLISSTLTTIVEPSKYDMSLWHQQGK